MISDFVFYIASFLIIISGLNLVLNPSPIYGGLGLIGGFFMVGVMYLLIGQEFFGVVQLLVYAGAIMVLFLFIIMLINPKKEETRLLPFGYILTAGLLVSAFAFKLIQTIVTVGDSKRQTVAEMFEGNQHGIKVFANVLFYDYLFVFEFIGIVMMVAIIGAVVISKKNYFPTNNNR